jgi:hypothetical protein
MENNKKIIILFVDHRLTHGSGISYASQATSCTSGSHAYILVYEMCQKSGQNEIVEVTVRLFM